MCRHLVNELINLLKIDCQQLIAAQYCGIYADPSDIGKNAAGHHDSAGGLMFC